MNRYDQLFKERLIGLLAAAKALDGPRSAEETARDAIALLDLLAADADRMAREMTQVPGDGLQTGGKDSGVEAFIRGNGLDRGKFEEWLKRFMPEVRDRGIGGMAPGNARRILDNPDGCLTKFREWLEAGTEKTAA